MRITEQRRQGWQRKGKERAARLAVICFIITISLFSTAQALSTGINSSRTLKVNAINVAFVNGTAVCSDGKTVYALNSSGVLWKKEIASSLLGTSRNYIVAAGGDSITLLSPNGTVVWSRKVEGVRAVAVSDSGYVVAGCDDGDVYLLNSSGGIVWVYNLKARVESVSILRNFIAVSDVYGNIYYFEKFGKFPWSFTSENGDVSWMYKTGWCIWKFNGLSRMCTYPEVEVKASDGGVFAVSKFMQYAYLFSKSGYELWNYSFDYRPVSFSADRRGDIFAVGCSNGVMYVFGKDGNVMWRMKFSKGAVVSVSENGRYIAAASGNLVCLFNSSGNLLWFSYTPDRVECIAVSNSGQIITSGGEVYLVVPEVPQFSLSKLSPTPAPTPAPTSTPAITQTPTPTPSPTPKPTPVSKKVSKKTSKSESPFGHLFSYLIFLPAGAGAVAGGLAFLRFKKKKAKAKKGKEKGKEKGVKSKNRGKKVRKGSKKVKKVKTKKTKK